MKGHITQTCDAELAKAAQTVKDATSDQTAAILRLSGAFQRVYAILRAPDAPQRKVRDVDGLSAQDKSARTTRLSSWRTT